MVNGAVVDPSAPTISLFDRGFMYGDGVFEVLRTYGGRPRTLEEHLARLGASARAFGISQGVPNARWIAEVHAVLSRCPWPESVIRLTLTRGVGAPSVLPRSVGAPTRVVMATELPALPPIETAGIRAITLRGVHRSSCSEGHKTLEYLSNCLARREAEGQGAGEAILLDADGRVVEATAANVFVVHDRCLRTTPDGVGLPGITRSLTIRAATEEGLQIDRGELTLTDLWTADEVFLTSSVRELIPVLRVDDHEVSERAGAVTQAVHRRLRALLTAR